MNLRRCILLVIISFFLSLNQAQAKSHKQHKQHPSKPLLTMSEYMAHNCKKGCVDEGDLLKSANKVAALLDIDFKDLLAITKVESRFVVKAKSGSNRGLMQVNIKYHRNKLKGKNVYDPYDNLYVGGSIYKECLVKSGGNEKKALNVCYNGRGDPRYSSKFFEARKEIANLLDFKEEDSCPWKCGSQSEIMKATIQFPVLEESEANLAQLVPKEELSKTYRSDFLIRPQTTTGICVSVFPDTIEHVLEKCTDWSLKPLLKSRIDLSALTI